LYLKGSAKFIQYYGLVGLSLVFIGANPCSAQRRVVTYWDSSQQIIKEAYYLSEGILPRMQGDYFRFYQDGTMAAKGTFLAGKKEGTFSEYYPNGNVKIEAHYQEGLKHGLFFVYDEDERMLQEAVFRNDSLVDQLTTFYNTGSVRSESSFSAGMPQGLVKN